MNDPAPNVANVDLGDLGDAPTSPGTSDTPDTPDQTAITMKPRAEKPKAATVKPNMQSRSRSYMNGPLYMQTSNNKILIRRVKRKDDGALKSLARWFLNNQTGFSFNLITLIFLAHICLPKARPHTSKFFTLSYYNSESGKYAIGSNDYYFISFFILLFTGLRAGFMEHLLAPFARKWGVSKRKEITRFSEQAWMLIYYSFFWTLGLYLYVQSPFFLNMKELWTGWPNRELDGLMKAYLLAQWAFWLQQLLVIHIEERRKDHWQMLIHHFITITLISASYCYHLTRVGNLILVLMDVVDIFLPLAKCLKYLGFTRLCDAAFGVFMVSWFVARHVFYLMTCYSIYKDVPEMLPNACFKGTNANLTGPFPIPDGWGHYLEPFSDFEGTICFSSSVQWGFLYCLLGLQVITIFWFFMIIRVAIRVLKGDGADDTRSDDEGEEEEEEFEYEEAQPLEEEVGVEAIDLKGWERRTGVKRAASSSGVSLPGHSDRKELLGRIGCEKQVD
ncbi:longevity assurance proteins LAG1/LAC1 [Annulohypoxylon maeteangense]|uniref:longevity assurance proteins LAG1/LAC1 n=1 Tax=Annulohypoxylon maeteangense TaxID=1927788 RepID=UPI002007B3B9|nr:longevity assurance proteins LAG1/LAC1 [Annulohypoxylon maeteangense]KAI0886265.1 longevity assurance proteins LAG1/LAC1 [Annulohypoxylon maeteangense]